MKRGIALIICLFAMTTRAHLTHAAEASLHEDELAPIKRKAYHSDDRDKRRKAACDRDRAYYAANKEKIAARKADYYAANKEKIAARKAAYRAAHKEKIAAQKAANKEKIAAYHAAHYAANKERRAAYQTAYRATNKEKIAAKNAAYRAANKGKIAKLAAGNSLALKSLQGRIDKAQDQPDASENPFLVRYNDACKEQEMNPATPGAVSAAEILCNLVKNLQSEQEDLHQSDDESEEADAASFTPITPYQALEDLLSGSEESPVEDD